MCKSKPHAKENVLLITGIRQSEEVKYAWVIKNIHEKRIAEVWCSPIFNWSQQDCESYMKECDLPRNPVKDAICISGECLCGAFAKNEEWAEIKSQFPEAAAEINRLHQIAIAKGHPRASGVGADRILQE